MATNETIKINRIKRNGQTSEFIELTHNRKDRIINISKVEEVNDDKNPQGHMESINVPINMMKALFIQIKDEDEDSDL